MNNTLTDLVRSYWNERIHDQEIARHPVGSEGFFRDLEEYRFKKLEYLPRVVDFSGYRDLKVLEIGCGIGLDLARFAAGGARVTGVDLAPNSIELARTLFAQRGITGEFHVMDGETLSLPDNNFDIVYAHGVIQYTANPPRMVAEMYRVLKPGGRAIAMLYNRVSWLNAMSKVMKVGLEHEDAPAFRTFSIGEAKALFSNFERVTIIPERFPVKTRLHHGWKAVLYNGIFVGLFNCLPKALVRRFGWHLMIFAGK